MDFCPLAPNPREASCSEPLCPKSYRNCSVPGVPGRLLRVARCENPPGRFVRAAETKPRLSRLAWFSFVCGGKICHLPPRAFLEGCCNKNLGLRSPRVRFDLGCPFYCSFFLSLMSERCIFVVVSTGMCCVQTDATALPALKRQRSDSVLISWRPGRILKHRHRPGTVQGAH